MVKMMWAMVNSHCFPKAVLLTAPTDMLSLYLDGANRTSWSSGQLFCFIFVGSVVRISGRTPAVLAEGSFFRRVRKIPKSDY